MSLRGETPLPPTATRRGYARGGGDPADIIDSRTGALLRAAGPSAEQRRVQREDAIDLALLGIAAGSVTGMLLIWKFSRP